MISLDKLIGFFGVRAIPRRDSHKRYAVKVDISMTEKLLEGVLVLYSTTGTEGGYLSIQDRQFIGLNPPSFGVEDNCTVWDKNDISRKGVTSNAEVLIDGVWLTLVDPIYKDPDFEISSLYRGELKGDFNADKRLSEKYNFRIKYAVERIDEWYGKGNWKFDKRPMNIIVSDGRRIMLSDTPETVPSRPYRIPMGATTRVSITWNDGTIEHRKISDELLIEQFDIKGLRMLEKEDIIKVLDPTTKQVICEGQVDEIPLSIFSQTIEGHFKRVRQDHSGRCDWQKYFTEGYCAELHRKR